MALIFQYGSNLDSERLNSPQRLRGEARYLGLAMTREPYELGFTVWSEGNGCAAADLVPGGTGPAWGALYEIPDALVRRETAGNRPSMDSIENEGVEYRRTQIEICQPNGQLLKGGAITWLVVNRRHDLRTELHYVRHILRGLLAKQVPRDYLMRAQRSILANNPALREPVNAFIARQTTPEETPSVTATAEGRIS